MVEAAMALRHRNDLAFVLMGSGDLEQSLRSQARGLTNVFFTGWLDSTDISTVLRSSHLGLCTSGKLSEREFLPNKVFAYLAEGVPIGSIFDGELRRLIEARGFGFNFSTTAQLIAETQSLADAPERHAAMAEAAKSFFASNCDANVIYRDYADHLESIAGRADHLDDLGFISEQMETT
jgi:colanic acid biosynthesis glycosyl transferase WcaI